MAKPTGEKTGKATKKGKLDGATDKLAELAQNPMARSMLAAGLVTAAAALTANQKVRKSAKKAGREAIDGAEAAADNASKVGAAIITAATDAVRRFMATATRAGSGGGSSEKSPARKSSGGKSKPGPKAGSAKAKSASTAGAAKRKPAAARASTRTKAAAPATATAAGPAQSSGAAGKTPAAKRGAAKGGRKSGAASKNSGA